MNDSELDLSRIAAGIERIANAISPKPLLEVEVTAVEKDGECMAYTVCSPDPESCPFIFLTIRFSSETDPKWRMGQRLKVTVT